MDADEFARFGAMHDLVSRMSAKLGLDRQAGRGDFYRHGTADNLVDQLEAICQLRAALDQVEAFASFGLRMGTPGTPDVADEVIADALGLGLQEARERIADAHQLAAELRPPDEYEDGQAGTRMVGYLRELPEPVQ